MIKLFVHLLVISIFVYIIACSIFIVTQCSALIIASSIILGTQWSCNALKIVTGQKDRMWQKGGKTDVRKSAAKRGTPKDRLFTASNLGLF
jgi:hypothetical protein